ncbi:GGDEF and EAL domain-containing protein [Pseudomonas sp. 8Z]|uniref:GGDEF and EAL domain-containing protein n=1 Tax=Pseudomonas sp. 8Z TaxID=2653166 RepID=UPI001357EEC8|nr:GGDEF and EAL domain-containing protein [Pseudomonas sp. 8Z]
MLGLLAWQLMQEHHQLLDNQRRLSQTYTDQLARHLSLSMRLKAQAAQAVLQGRANEPLSLATQAEQLGALHSIFPSLDDVIRLDGEGQLLTDSNAGSGDLPFIRSLQLRNGQTPYRYTLSPRGDSQLYLALQQSDGGLAVLRMSANSVRNWLHEHQQNEYQWLLEEITSRRVIARFDAQSTQTPIKAQVTPEEHASTLRLFALDGSDWQLRALFDSARASSQLMPVLTGKFILLGLLSLLTLLALHGIQRERRSLQRLNAESRRSLRQAASALGAVEECILVTQANGVLRYLNPQAEKMFGLDSQSAWDRHLIELLPDLDPQLFNAPQQSPDLEPVLVRLESQDRPRLLAVTRSDISEGAHHSGYVWVLRDVTDEQQAMRVLQETRRRYQDIFDGTGVALCVLDLSGLHTFLQQQRVRDAVGLQRWLQADPQHHAQLLQQLHITEANQVALNLLGASSTVQAWEQLFNSSAIASEDLSFKLTVAVVEGPNLVELETQLVTRQGLKRHVWLVLRLPELLQDYQAVTLSISDITSRKRIELSLIERERFWSEVVRSVPDLLYVHDMQNKRALFSNHSLGLKLGYSPDELKAMGDEFWTRTLHPDDSDYYERIRNLQKVVGDGMLLESVLRWRHRNGQWRWFSIREQALARDTQGKVSRLIGVAKDITEQIEQNQSLRDSEQRYRLLAESISDVIFSTDSTLKLNYISPSVQPVLGYSVDWMMRHGLQSLAANPQQLNGLNLLLERIQDALDERSRLDRLREELPDQLFVFDCLRADGHKIPVELRLVLMWDENGRFEGILGVGRDISQQRRAEKDLRMAATVFEHSSAAILVTDPAGYIVQVNKAFSRISGYSAGQVLDQLPGMLTADRQQAPHVQYILGQLSQRGAWEGEVWLKRRDGENFPAWVGITAVHDEEGDLVSYVCFFSDISERKASEQRIHRLAYYDALTHLPNRTLFQDRLHSALQHAERHDEWVVLMFLDLDRFKPINDSLGHAAGDRMLKDVAVRLSACVDGDDTVARMGGDEFTLLLQPRPSREAALNRAIHVAEQILASLARPFVLEGREFFVTASIGIALAPQDGNELSQLMKNADTAMYHAKERGKNNFQFYQAEMNASALERLELESDLRHAQEQGQFVLHYQPQFSGDGKRLTGVEALLRWNHPTRGLVPPDDFIPVLEELGLVVQVGEWVLEEACRQLKIWHEEKIRIPKVSVNLSARQFAEGDLESRIAAIIQRTGIPPACLEVELTESILMQDVTSAMQMLHDLKRLGLCIAVDDFGTGYSSLNYLKQFPIDVLKIDRSFVDGLPDGEQDAQIARAIIAMAHSLNMMVIAEGVETQAQLEFLREHGCDEVQGYLFGKPMQAQQFSAQFSGTALFMLD